jgi:hypothetical protein
MLSLRELQRRFFTTITRDPGEAPGATADAELLAAVRGGGGLGPRERLTIYADMYRARLLDVLGEDFPRVLAVLGEREFSACASRYLAVHPSEHPSVRHVGARFADFLGAMDTGLPFLADLARLEWARVEVFDGPDAEPLRLSDLASIPAGEWAALRFRPVPACLLVESAWPVHAIWSAAGEREADRARPIPVEPERSILRVWREGFSVSHVAMGEVETRAFRSLQHGEPFAALCAAIGDDLAPEAAARVAGSLLMRWLEDGLLAAPAPDAR